MINYKEIFLKSLKKENGEISSSRIFSYIMMLIIFLLGITHVVIEIVNSIICWKEGIPYIIPFQNITVIGLWLTHQLVLMGIYKTTENPFKNIIKSKENKKEVL